jgi:hypothetical protein
MSRTSMQISPADLPGLFSFDSYRSVFINSLLILWAFQLTPDPKGPQDDMGFMNGMRDAPAYGIDFKTRIPEMELRSMMEGYPGVE